jgi:hypothetical protein
MSERSIPDILKDISKKLKIDLSNGIYNFNKTYEVEYLSFSININNNKNNYYSNIDLYKIINDMSINVNIEIDIPKDFDIDYVVAITIHEIRHIYDIYTVNSENDMSSFINDFHIRKLKIGNYTNFIYLIYLSLEHELIARNNMIYPYIGFKNITKEESIKIVRESFIWKSLESLNNFNHIEFIKSINEKELIKLTNLFIKDVAKDYNICLDINDIIIFYKKWEDYFKNISVEWENELYKEIDKIYEFKRYSYNENIIGGVNRLFLEIYFDLFKK